MTRSGYSSTVSAMIAAAPEFAVVPLIGGFCARASCPRAGWWRSYKMRELRIECAPVTALDIVQSVRVYEVEDVQNLTLQKTLLTLESGVLYRVRFVFVNQSGAVSYRSPWVEVQTLARGAPIM